MRSAITNYLKLDKDWILQQVSEEFIMARYLNISAQTIYNCVNSSRKIYSPFRGDDQNQSVGFTINGRRKLIVRDFGGYFHGDCFDVVGWAIGQNPNTTIGFVNILADIAKEFNLVKGDVQRRQLPLQTRVKKIIIPTFKDWDYYSVQYWWQAGVNKRTLDRLRIYPVESVYSNDNLIYKCRNIKEPAFGYYSGKDENGIPKWKIYLPFSHGLRFYANHFDCDYVEPLGYTDDLIIAKSRKDFATIVANHPHPDLVQGIIVPGEGFRMTPIQVDWCLANTSRRYAFADGDRSGLLMLAWYRRVIQAVPLFFKKNYAYKDMYDFAIKYPEKAKELITYLYTNKNKLHGKQQYNDNGIVNTIPAIHPDLPF